MSDSYKRYLFEYPFAKAEWGIEVVARDPLEARARLRALPQAQFKGEVHGAVRARMPSDQRLFVVMMIVLAFAAGFYLGRPL